MKGIAAAVVAAVVAIPVLLLALLSPANPATAGVGNCPAKPEVFAEAHMQPNAVALGRCIAQMWPQLTVIGGWRPEDPYADHPSGQALDVMMPNGGHTAADVTLGNEIATWVMSVAESHRVVYVLWRHRIWNYAGMSPHEPVRPPDQWRLASENGAWTPNHMDHLHIATDGTVALGGQSAPGAGFDGPPPAPGSGGGGEGFIDPIPQGAFLDWAYMARRLAEEEPWWEPGSRNGYHLLNIGWTVGEIVRRISGLSLGEFFQREVARPLGLDFWIGLPDAAHLQFVKVLPYIPGDIWQHVGDFAQLCIDRPDSRPARAIANTGGFVALDAESGAYAVNDFANLKAEVGGAGGVTNARGLALMYDQLAAGGGKLVSADQVWRMSQVAMVSHADPILQILVRLQLVKQRRHRAALLPDIAARRARV